MSFANLLYGEKMIAWLSSASNLGGYWLALVGAVFGVLIPSIWNLVIFGFRYLKKDRIEGTWFNHFYSFKGEANVFVVERIKISKGVRSRWVARSKLDYGNKAKYSGVVAKEDKFLIFSIRGNEHEEQVYCRFLMPNHDSGEQGFVGVSIAQDLSGSSTAAVNFLSHKQLTEEEFVSVVKKRSKVVTGKRTIKVLN